jgi:hypothetical protein
MSEILPNETYCLTAKQLHDLADVVDALDNKASKVTMNVNLSGDIDCVVTLAYDETGTFGVTRIEGAGE